MTEHILHIPDNTSLDVIVCFDETMAVGVTRAKMLSYCPFCGLEIEDIKIVEGDYD